MALSRSRARQFCQAVHDEAGGRINRWVGIVEVGKRLGLEPGPAIVLADDCELAGWVRHDRSHLRPPKRNAGLPARVTLSGEGWELLQPKRGKR